MMLLKMPSCMSRQHPKRFENQTNTRPRKWVNSNSILQLRHVSRLARCSEPDCWIAPQGHPPFLAVLVGFPEPPLRPLRAYFKVKATGIGQPFALLAIWTCCISALGIGQHGVSRLVVPRLFGACSPVRSGLFPGFAKNRVLFPGMFPAAMLAVNVGPCTPLQGKPLIFQRKSPLGVCS